MAPESWPPQRLEEEKENPQKSPNGRQLGLAGGGAAGRAGASLRDLIQGRALCTVPAASRGPSGWPGPRSCLPHVVEAPRSARSGSLPQPRQARRELRRSTPVQATHDSPEGWEKPPGRLGWTSKFRNQLNPTRGLRSGLLGLRSGRQGHCGGHAAAAGESGRARTESLRPSSNSPTLAKGGQADGKGLHERGGGREAVLPEWLFLAQARATPWRGGSHSRTLALSTPRWHAARLEWTGGPFQSQRGARPGPLALLRHSAAGCRATCASSHLRLPALGAASPSRSRAPWTGPLGSPRARRSFQVSLGAE